MSAHTPAPWTCDRIDAETKGDDSAAFWIAEDCHAGEVLAVVIEMPKDAQVAEANARLIASAPELLNVLHECAELLDDYSDVNDGDDGRPVANRAMSLLQVVDAAIAKAEGGH